MSDFQRISMLTRWPCSLCGRTRRAVRRVIRTKLADGLVEIASRGGFIYCPTCDGAMAAIDCVNSDADEETPL